jgi:phosphotriesterase-related protein
MRLAFLFLCWLIATAAHSSERVLICTDGLHGSAEAGLILPHEHIFTDLRGPDTPGYGEAEERDVVRVMKPLLEAAKLAGVSTIIECTTIGVGRNLPFIARLGRDTGLHIVAPTGVYGRSKFAPAKYAAMNEDELANWMMEEIVIGIEGTGLRAGFIKTAASENELRPVEEKFLRASVRASKQTGVAIASHTTSGEVARKQIRVLDHLGLALDRFIWVHAQAETNLEIHQELARRGVYIELDSVGASEEEDNKILKIIQVLVAAGASERILISHDAGWYNPGQPNGGSQRGYTSLITSFIPKLKAAGFDEALVRKLTRENPFRAFSVPKAHEQD